ncbi:MAG TPA: outer membrane protein assembly factor BamA, partial [Planctomycetota bacterium]|nr:outer membrane protein assembly factor BamA [Planctomycetota bacterium]
MRSRRGKLRIVAGLLLLSAARAGWAQAAPQDWEGKRIARVETDARREGKPTIINQSGLKPGVILTQARLDQAYKSLWAMNRFEHVDIQLDTAAAPPGEVFVTIRVREYEHIDRVEFTGAGEVPETQLRQDLRLVSGEPLNPFHLKQDREKLRNQYLDKGYHFSQVEEDVRPSPAGGVVLTWRIVEGPKVGVEEIVITGNDSISASDLKRYMLTKENGTLLFITTSEEPFVERNLREDLQRIKLYYQLEGWLDIQVGERVFLKDLEFSDDKRTVTIHIHVDEGTRYRIRNVVFDVDPSGPRVFGEEEMRAGLLSRAGEPYTEPNATRDVARLRDRYGERAYIQAEITYDLVTNVETHELDLVFRIKENDRIYVGRILFEGNTKTREEVFRREFTRTGFVPGEEYNQRSLERAIRRITDRGYIEPGGMNPRRQETDEPRTRDVVVEVQEGQTGSVRFAAGYSSSFGVLGILEFTQRNFDLADIPTSFGDMIGGTGFAGGGQFFRIRLAPAARRQSYSVDFREPFVLGYDVGLGLRAYRVSTLRESYDDERFGGVVSLDKRWEPWAVQVSFKAERIDIENVETDAPPAVRDIEGENRVISLTPAIIYDTRDSIIFPTSGFRASVSVEYAGQVLPGTFDFNKLTWETEGHVTVLETESKLRHVMSYQSTFGWVHGARQDLRVPLFERFYAGGRDSIRGFDFRGMGPHEAGDPVGGEALVFLSAEYSYPLF